MKFKSCKRICTCTSNYNASKKNTSKFNFLSVVKYSFIIVIGFIVLFILYFQSSIKFIKQTRIETRIASSIKKLTNNEIFRGKTTSNHTQYNNYTNLKNIPNLISISRKLLITAININTTTSMAITTTTTSTTTTTKLLETTLKKKFWYEKLFNRLSDSSSEICPLIPPNLGLNPSFNTYN